MSVLKLKDKKQLYLKLQYSYNLIASYLKLRFIMASAIPNNVSVQFHSTNFNDNASTRIDFLPMEMIFLIFERLNMRDLCSVFLTQKSWSELKPTIFEKKAKNFGFSEMRPKIKNEFGGILDNTSNLEDWFSDVPPESSESLSAREKDQLIDTMASDCIKAYNKSIEVYLKNFYQFVKCITNPSVLDYEQSKCYPISWETYLLLQKSDPQQNDRKINLHFPPRLIVLNHETNPISLNLEESVNNLSSINFQEAMELLASLPILDYEALQCSSEIQKYFILLAQNGQIQAPPSLKKQASVGAIDDGVSKCFQVLTNPLGLEFMLACGVNVDLRLGPCYGFLNSLISKALNAGVDNAVFTFYLDRITLLIENGANLAIAKDDIERLIDSSDNNSNARQLLIGIFYALWIRNDQNDAVFLTKISNALDPQERRNNSKKRKAIDSILPLASERFQKN
jgi:hypothetical protein